MRLLKFSSRFPEPKRLQTNRVVLQRPALGDFEAWAALRHESQSFLRPFEPKWARDELSRSAFKARLRRQESDITSGRGLPWFLFDREKPSDLMGGLTISNIRRGVSDAGTLGYWMGERYSGKGLMKEALMCACEDLFTVHHLHRIEAATVVDNPRSQHLLKSCGFQEEGLARRYLKINGEWRDHILFARLIDDVEPPKAIVDW